ncbi:cupin domain-containing protein [Cyclobacterium jeungdonense]|uniref:Cupin domain-containing protein n=1 Tax=Cyclobacterium jeungdonense TaxID=708087 RepID=A0ABT8CDL3_9BACT|nr:cupin domain-containing protein [Cyclobacterium jeungdonense]MDN3690059.1 cupin domain-containing protein [Cyclobacterium jeungdonense]
MIGSNKGDAEKDDKELEKSTSHLIAGIIEYLPRSVISKTILKKITGNITVSCLDAGEEMEEKSLPFDIYVQIIDGTAEILIDKEVYTLVLGEGIVIPAHSFHHFNANEQFKMISTVIKSGYED